MALEAHLRKLAAGESPGIQRFRKRIAFERFIARLQDRPESPWFLKGAFALELRFGDRARVTRDLDLGVDLAMVAEGPLVKAQVAERLQTAASLRIGDYFEYAVGEGDEIFPERDVRAYRFNVQGFLADRLFEVFVLDVGATIPLVVPAQEVPETGLLAFAGIAPRAFRAISLSQHFAEKVHALSYPWEGRENTRVKDLVDIALILEVSPPEIEEARNALRGIFEARGTHAPLRTIPDPPSMWADPYILDAAETGVRARTIDEAMGLLRAYWSKLFP